jgi:5-methylthioadenosine/S-adenosylhomocysteine deaminase
VSRYLIVGDPVVALGAEACVSDAALIVEDDRIEAVGPREELEGGGPFDRVLGSKDHVVMPGFVNTHFHSQSAAGPGLFDTIFEINNVQMNAGSGSPTEEDVYVVTLYALLLAIKGGQTAAVDMFYGTPRHELFGAEAALQAYADIGFRGALGLACRDQNLYIHEDDACFLARLPADLAAEVQASEMGYAWPVDDVLATSEKLVERWQGRHGRIRVIMAADWTPSCSDGLYRRCRALADRYQTGLTSHVLETRAEMVFNVARYGETAVRRLERLGVLAPDFCAAHFVWATDDDLDAFAASGAVAASCPGSNLRLCAGIARVRDLMSRGGRVAFGTDNISFSDTEDFFQELRLACFLQRTPHRVDVGRLDSEQVLRAAGENGARAVGFEGKIGALRPGMLADLLVLRRERIFGPRGRYENARPLDVILDRADASDLESVLIAGRIVLDDGRLTTVDEASITERLHDATTRLYAKSPASRRLWELGDLVKPAVIDFYRQWYDLPVTPASVYNARLPPEHVAWPR